MDLISCVGQYSYPYLPGIARRLHFGVCRMTGRARPLHAPCESAIPVRAPFLSAQRAIQVCRDSGARLGRGESFYLPVRILEKPPAESSRRFRAAESLHRSERYKLLWVYWEKAKPKKGKLFDNMA